MKTGLRQAAVLGVSISWDSIRGFDLLALFEYALGLDQRVWFASFV